MSWREFALYAVQGLTTGSTYALMAIGISVVYGATRVVNFPMGDIAAVAALLGGSSLAIRSGVPIGIALILAMAAAGALSVVVSFALLPPRRRASTSSGEDHSWIIAAVAASIVISELASQIWGSDQVLVASPVSQGIVNWGGVVIRKPALALFAAAVLVGVILDQVLRRTRWGIRVRAAGGDAIGVAVSGINLRRVYIEVFFVGGAIAGLTGILLGPISPPSAFIGFTLTIKGFIAAAIGGLGYIRGALFGGLLLGLLEAYGGRLLGSQWQDPLALTVLILVLLITPTGIMRIRRVRTV
jgi:branched-chain amino acid transport system permease protein